MLMERGDEGRGLGWVQFLLPVIDKPGDDDSISSVPPTPEPRTFMIPSINRQRVRILLFAVTMLCVPATVPRLSAADAPQEGAPAKIGWIEPVEKQMEGWTVYVDPQLLDGPFKEEGGRALAMLANHLQRIAILVPEKQLGKLREVGIWIERSHPELGSMQYHPEVEWLTQHGYDPRLVKKVHIPRAAALSSREQLLKHPAVILHELAHAYHDQVLGFDDQGILNAYQKAMKEGKYAKVLLYTGKEVRHYATTDHKEYFAEATEAYFYRNDFYPFVRAELRLHDPTGLAEMERVWGKVD